MHGRTYYISGVAHGALGDDFQTTKDYNVARELEPWLVHIWYKRGIIFDVGIADSHNLQDYLFELA